MKFNIKEIVKDKLNNKGVITRVDGKYIYVLWEDGSCGINKETDLYKTGKCMDIVYFLSILKKSCWKNKKGTEYILGFEK